MVKKLRVKNAKIICLRRLGGRPRGTLLPLEALRDIPFEIKRIFFIRGVMDPKTIRGNHAHIRTRQVLLCPHGSFKLHLDDGTTKQRILMRDPAVGVLIGPGVWVQMTNFSSDCVVLALADEYFDESEYLRDYCEFKKLNS